MPTLKRNPAQLQSTAKDPRARVRCTGVKAGLFKQKVPGVKGLGRGDSVAPEVSKRMLGEEALAAVLRNTDGEIVVAKPHGWEGVSPSMYRPFPNAQSD